MGFNVLMIVLGLIRGSKKWSKYSKCKSLIKQAGEHLIIQKKRRESNIRQSRTAIALLLQSGQQHIALSRVDQLYKDQSRLSAYEQIEQFCHCICANLSDISKSCDLSKDVQEAVSSLIYAASRCGEIPELNLLRCLFQQRFGHKFERVNVQLLPWNTVNSELKQNLSGTFVLSDNAKRRIVNEIEKEHILSLELPTNRQNSVLENQKVTTNFVTSTDSNCGLKNCVGKKKKVEFMKNLATPPVDDTSKKATKFEDMVRRIGTKVSHNHEEEPRLCHVHPKLPDYENLVSKFTNLKKDRMQKRRWLWW